MKRIITVLTNPGVDLGDVTVNGICKFNQRTTFGEDCHVNGVWIDGPGPVQIGHKCHFGKGIKIFTQNHNYNSRTELPYDKTFVVKGVEIGNYVWVGSHAIILPGARIGEGAIVQAGAVVHGNLERCGIYGGNPAVRFASRDIEVFEELNAYKT